MKSTHKHPSLIIISLLFVFVSVSCVEDTLPVEGTDADFTHFEFSYTSGDIKSADIDRYNKTITADIGNVADLSALAPVFVLSHQAKAYVNGVEQISGVSQHDFSKVVEYQVVSGNNQITNTYRVTISAESGTIVEINDMIINKTTTLSASEYYVKGDIMVEEGVYFSILPGCRFRLSPGSKIIVKPNASLLAKGTAERPIRFFSTIADDATQAWDGFEFNSPKEVEFDYCTFENGGQNSPMMTLNNTQIGFQRCEVNDIHNTGFKLDAKSIFRIFDYNVLNNVGENDNYYPIYADNINSLANLSDNNTINTQKGIFIQHSEIKRSITLYSQTCPYIFVEDITCDTDDVTFFIREGVHIKMANNKGIYLGNSKILFQAKGLQSKPIVFSGIDKTNGSWDGIVFEQNLLNGSGMSFCEIEYGGNSKNQGAVRCSGTKPDKISIQNCAILHSESHCVYIERLADAMLIDNIYNIAAGYTDVFRE